ncbi:TDT family transporter [Nocardioides flavescens]|uniref:C4-dicarboxylate ABC transporter n=1 Tax=Nocardioides flavescens TaxID=2691959 RepID=A0A6L7EY57_9ACTN|nr:TDT family transporter [Nocardioides flavescens]MXG90876.1 C4-dicarboxylate ABC transporter [Nocardioides flavescens]
MSSTQVAARAELATTAPPRPRLLRDLEGAPALGYVGPNWFASVMGTGIVAVALASLPFRLPGAVAAALVVWLLAVALLVAVTGATLAHHRRHPATARGHLDDPVMSHFYGAPAMALMTVGAGTVLVGHRLVGTGPALVADAVLWTVGTALGLATAVVVPFRAITSHDVRPDSAFGGWLMPVVPPMVSAATGALLVPHLPAGQAQQTMLLACYAFFGLTLIASLLMVAAIWQRLLHHGLGAAGAVPTLWIVLGPLGQSVTAAHHLGQVAPGVLGAPYAGAFRAQTLVYGVPVLGFALLWLALALALTVRTARAGLPFGLTWWSFTFPVGTVVTGASGLASATGLVALDVLTGLLLVGLVAAWTVVLVRTVHGVARGRLLLDPRPA